MEMYMFKKIYILLLLLCKYNMSVRPYRDRPKIPKRNEVHFWAHA